MFVSVVEMADIVIYQHSVLMQRLSIGVNQTVASFEIEDLFVPE